MIADAKRATGSIILLVFIIVGVVMSVHPALGQTAIKTCDRVDVKAVELNYRPGVLRDLKPDKEVFFDKEQSDGKGEVTITAVGPSLGSSDIRGMSYELGCTASGIQVTISIFGSSCFPNCSALRNLTFRPEARLILATHETQAEVKAQWVMFLENGTLAPGGVHPRWIADTTVP